MAVTINGNGTVAGIAVGGLPDGIVDADMIAAGAAGATYAFIEDRKDDANGGNLTPGSWQIRDLNTETYDPGNIVSISSNTFTLANAGNYVLSWGCPSYRMKHHQSRLWNVTSDALVDNGTDGYGNTSYCQGIVWTIGNTRITQTGSVTYRVEHRNEHNLNHSQAGGIKSPWTDLTAYTWVRILKET